MARSHAPLTLSRWLLAVVALIFLMVVIGGITRLTESGLSITEWKPVTGALPPLSEQHWQEAFEKYRQIPEFTEIKGPRGMTLADYKFIYFWEWLHRQMGRLIGLAFALPLLWFWARGMIPPGYKWRFLVLLALGGLQGVIGWWMVASGLSVRTDVSHYRLAIHLLTALLILAAMLWVALDLRRLARGSSTPARLTAYGLFALLILFSELMYGAFMAGLNAGHVSHTWPLMHGRIFPYGVEWSGGFIDALTNNLFLIHFIHRWWAWVVAGVLIVLARRAGKIAPAAGYWIYALLGVQILLGITTVLTRVNLTVAVSHQAVGTLLLAATVYAAHILGESRT